jgi:hypothetical protein
LRQGLVLVCGLLASTLCACSIIAARGQAARSTVCRNFSYAGLESSIPTAGIRAELEVAERPVVRSGHVGGWIGVGGPHDGPGGTPQWLQAGYAAFADGTVQLYYEVALPGAAPQYHVVRAAVTRGERHLVSILEEPGRRGVWRVWVDGVAAGPTYFLMGSHGRYRPQGIGESWSPTAGACNTYAWMFGDVTTAARPGGPWGPVQVTYRWNDPGYRVKFVPPGSFAAFSR